MKRVLFLVLLIGLAVSGTAAAQSLAAIAQKEEARRKAIKKPSRVYTNQDVTPSGRPGPASAVDTGTPGTAQAGAQGAAPEAAGRQPAEQAGAAESTEAGEEKTDEELRAEDEARWRDRMRDARAALERNQIFEQALQSRINALWADFTARDDPAQRAAIEAERRKAITQLDRVKAEIVEQQKAIADIEEEARRAGVPPGWLR